MARKFLTHLDMAGNQLLNATFEKLSAAPNTGNFEGRMYYNTTNDLIYVYTGSVWTPVGSVTDIQGTAGEVEVSASIGSVQIGLPSTINVNAQTATALQTARTISLGGDLSGSASFDGTSNITINATVDSQSSVDSIAGTPDQVNVSASVGAVTVSLPSTINVNTSGNAATASALQTARTIALGGDLSGSASFDGSASITITADITPDSVLLGTDTTGDYVATIDGTDGVSVSGSGTEGRAVTIANTDKGSSQNIFKTIEGDTGAFTAGSNSASVTFAGGTGIITSASSGTLTITNDGVTSLSGTANQIDVSASNGDVAVSLPSSVIFPGTVTLNADPQQALEAATKQYVDAVAEGLHIHASVQAATTASVDLSNAPSSIDGVTLTDGMRVLVKNQSSAAENGIYTYSASADALVRASDFNSAEEIAGGDFVFVTGGNLYDNTGWVQTEEVSTVGTDPIVWTQFSGAGTYLAGNGLELNGSLFSIDTDVTVDVSTAQTLTNKTLTSPVVSGLYLSDNNIVVEGTDNTHETTVVFTDPTQDNTITFKDETGTVALISDIPTSTDGVAEGSTNLYFTTERAEDAIGAILTDTATVDFTYTDNSASAGSITADVKLQASDSYLLSASGLSVDIPSLEAKLVTDSFTKKATATVGNGTATAFEINHGLGTRDVIVQVYKNSSVWEQVEVDVLHYSASDPTNVNKITVSFANPPSSEEYRVVVIG